MRRSRSPMQNTCPACIAPPYPAGFACANCGLVGLEPDSVERLRVLPGWLMAIILVALPIIAIVPFLLIITS